MTTVNKLQRRKVDTLITADQLRSILTYNRGTGLFKWKKPSKYKPSYRHQVAGTINRLGYRQITIHGVTHLAHRLAWLHVHGRWPTATIDHKNQNKQDNRIHNLREATHGENQQNKGPRRRPPVSGFRGVYPCTLGKTWSVRISPGHGQRIKSYGTFASLEEAAAVADRVFRDQHGEFFRRSDYAPTKKRIVQNEIA